MIIDKTEKSFVIYIYIYIYVCVCVCVYVCHFLDASGLFKNNYSPFQ